MSGKYPNFNNHLQDNRASKKMCPIVSTLLDNKSKVYDENQG
ncbi:hypothetical protein A1OE_370 [Candidatus Endolissoclinum faulkneri L2]|uniref:Uncharacterized protein n=1 Tax=Candidatus Endolissoclinum faulkneri L2 TaxID=1193729 RepID=K7YG34_9PROT|nr:hypothetical protein A1OE_370 [Candidatus Endolissoclinum faulkneri L2]